VREVRVQDLKLGLQDNVVTGRSRRLRLKLMV
jgi:hypothetical protein